MLGFFLQKIGNIPLVVWILQIAFVIAALLLFALLLARIDPSSQNRLSMQIAYVLAMIVINIIWRIALTKLFPSWF